MRPDLAIADHHVRLTAENRCHELWDVLALILVIRVGVDDHVRSQLQPGVEPGLEGGGQPLVVGQADDVVDAALARYLNRPVGRAVVDDQPFDGVESGYLAGKMAERHRQLCFLVETGDLDDELHGADPNGIDVIR